MKEHPRNAFTLLSPATVSGPSRETSFAVRDEVAEDLGVAEIANRIAGPGITSRQVHAILTNPSTSVEVIGYRNEIVETLVGDRGLLEGIEALLPRIRELFYFGKSRSASESPLLHAIWRLGELELYVECVETLEALLAKHDPAARGLRDLAGWIHDLRETETFRRMKEELPVLRAGLKSHKSITLGINLDERLRPVEATLVSVNDRTFESASLFGKLFGPSPGKREFETIAPIHADPSRTGGGPVFPDDPEDEGWGALPLSPLFQDIEVLLRSLLHPIVEGLKSYLQINASFLRSLAVEFAFLAGAARLVTGLEGLPFCRPELAGPAERTSSARGLYNLHLAVRSLRTDAPSKRIEPESIVRNELRLDESGRIALLTGPNQGGKTTYTQAVGLFHLLAQAGLLVPAESARLSPVDAIETHFPIAEKGALSTGRLAEESERLASIFRRIGPQSLVLLNESLSSTSPKESRILAEEVVRALRFVGARGVFATHLHDLAEAVESINAGVDGESAVFSLVAGIEIESELHRRTYAIDRGKPTGTSYAVDIARRSGISFEDLIAGHPDSPTRNA